MTAKLEKFSANQVIFVKAGKKYTITPEGVSIPGEKNLFGMGHVFLDDVNNAKRNHIRELFAEAFMAHAGKPISDAESIALRGALEMLHAYPHQTGTIGKLARCSELMPGMPNRIGMPAYASRGLAAGIAHDPEIMLRLLNPKMDKSLNEAGCDWQKIRAMATRMKEAHGKLVAALGKNQVDTGEIRKIYEQCPGLSLYMSTLNRDDSNIVSGRASAHKISLYDIGNEVETKAASRLKPAMEKANAVLRSAKFVRYGGKALFGKWHEKAIAELNGFLQQEGDIAMHIGLHLEEALGEKMAALREVSGLQLQRMGGATSAAVTQGGAAGGIENTGAKSAHAEKHALNTAEKKADTPGFWKKLAEHTGRHKGKYALGAVTVGVVGAVAFSGRPREMAPERQGGIAR